MTSRQLLALLLLPALARCGETLPPYQTVAAPLTPAQREPSITQPTLVGVCYNALTTTAEAVLSIAREGCPAGTVPQPEGRDYSLIFCPLFQPARATFACTKP